VNSVFTTQTKCAVACVLVSLAFVSQASAVLRPLFPIKPAAPSNGELIVIGDELALGTEKKPVLHHRGQAKWPSISIGAVPCIGCTLTKMSARETRIDQNTRAETQLGDRKMFSPGLALFST
jgi:hypothetical protein